MEEAGLALEDAYVTNAVKHFRHESKGKRRIHVTPTLAHWIACAPFLTRELAMVRPRGVLLLGAFAARAVLGGDARVTALHGRRLPWPDERADHPEPEWAMVAPHPSSVLRSRER